MCKKLEAREASTRDLLGVGGREEEGEGEQLGAMGRISPSERETGHLQSQVSSPSTAQPDSHR